MKIFGLGPYVGRLISFLIAVSVTWIGNRLFTFRRKGTSAAHIEWAKFALVCAIGFALNFGTYAALIAGVPFIAHAPVFGVAVGSLVAMFFNFFAARRLVFR
jgi:putative flippase GtrA